MGYKRYRIPLAWLGTDERVGWLLDDTDVDSPMSDLAECFPCLIGRPGVRPWDPDALDAWADENGMTATELYAARFILHVWDGKHAWKCGPFDLVDALDFWDETHRTAFVSWVLDPWWPLSLHLASRYPQTVFQGASRTELADRDTPLLELPDRTTLIELCERTTPLLEIPERTTLLDLPQRDSSLPS